MEGRDRRPVPAVTGGAGQPQKVVQVISRIANPTGMRVTQILLEAEQVLVACDVRNLSEAAKAAAKLAEIEAI